MGKVWSENSTELAPGVVSPCTYGIDLITHGGSISACACITYILDVWSFIKKASYSYSVYEGTSLN